MHGRRHNIAWPAYARRPWRAGRVRAGFNPHPHQRQEAIERRDAGEESLADIGRTYNVSGATIPG
jgi:hypothetical protein